MQSVPKSLLSVFCAAAMAAAQTGAIPATYQTAYSDMQTAVTAFSSTVTSQWNGKPANVLWSGDLLYANSNQGLALLTAQKYAGILADLNALQSLGVKAVTVTMGLPILDQNFYAFNGDPQDYASMVAVFSKLQGAIHQRGMKMIVESAVLFIGSFSSGSGFNLTGYYSSLSDSQFIAARVRNVLAIAQQVQPDYINLNSEPDTDLALSGKSGVYGPAKTYTNYIASVQTIVQQVKAAGVTIPLGAGVGTWLNDGNANSVVAGLLASGIDYLDLHVYPVNRSYLPALITYANMAQQAGKRVAISECWDLKVSDQEVVSTAGGFATSAQTYARDPFSFWAPLDQAFLQSLVNFSNWKNLLYFSPFWSGYFFAYLDYNTYGSAPYTQVSADAVVAAQTAITTTPPTLSSTGKFYSALIGGQSGAPLAITLSAASYASGNLAPDSIVSIFGANLATGTAQATTLPLPAQLSGTSASITDSGGNQQPLLLFYVSPTQINATLPPGLASGPAVINITSNGAVVAQSNITLAREAPGIFTANQTGQGVPIAQVVTVHSDGSRATTVTFQGNSVGNYTPLPINLGTSTDQSVLVLYGTGIRGVSSLANASVTIGTTNASVLYAGPSDPTHYVSFDQVNISLPHSLAAAGQVNLVLTLDGVNSNTVTLAFQ